MSKIKKLAAEQETMLPAFHQKWLNIGLCTKPANRPRAETAISKVYALVDLPKPSFMWVDSPLSGSIAKATHPDLRPESQLQQSRLANWFFRIQLWNQHEAQCDRQFIDELRVQLGYQIWNQLKNELWSPLQDQLKNQLREQNTQPMASFLSGQQEAYWIAYYKFASIAGVLYDEYTSTRLAIATEIAKSCMWWEPYEKVCVVGERPSAIHFNDEKRLHCDHGPAIEFRDKWKLYFINGIAVDEYIVMEPERITIESIEAESNADVREIMITQMGVERYLKDNDAKVLDMDSISNGCGGEITRALMTDKHDRKYLVANDGSTDRVYYMRVPDTCQSCSEAENALVGDENKVLMWG